MDKQNFPKPPAITELEIVRDLIISHDLDMENYIPLIKLVQEGQEFIGWLSNKFTERFSDDLDGLYRDYESLLMARDYLTNQSARAKALYRACGKKFMPSSGTALDKEKEIDRRACPYKFYDALLEEKIKTLDNRCTAAKQQQRILDEAVKRNLFVE